MDRSKTYLLIGEALASGDEDLFVAEWATSSIFDADKSAANPDYDEIVAYLHDIWTAAHLTVREIRRRTGLSQAAFAQRYCIPKRSLENWERSSGAEARTCPPYVVIMLAQITGLVNIF